MNFVETSKLAIGFLATTTVTLIAAVHFGSTTPASHRTPPAKIKPAHLFPIPDSDFSELTFMRRLEPPVKQALPQVATPTKETADNGAVSADADRNPYPQNGSALWIGDTAPPTSSASETTLRPARSGDGDAGDDIGDFSDPFPS